MSEELRAQLMAWLLAHLRIEINVMELDVEGLKDLIRSEVNAREEAGSRWVAGPWRLQ